MKHNHTLIIAALAAIGLGQVQAGPVTVEPKAPKGAVQIAPVSQSRWSIGAGAVVREIEGDFHLRSPGRLSSGGLFRRPSGRGDVGFFTGGSGIVQYDDGQVGPDADFGAPSGTYANGVINNPTQVTDSGRTDTLGANGISDIKFHTTGTEYSYSPREFHSSDSETGVGPYLELRYAAFQGERVDVNVVFGYSWVGVDLGSGKGVLATITETNRRYTYAYDGASIGSGFSGPYPEVVDATDTIIIINGANANADSPGSNFQDPRKSVSRSSRTVAELTGSASLDIDLHELVLAPVSDLPSSPCASLLLSHSVGDGQHQHSHHA